MVEATERETATLDIEKANEWLDTHWKGNRNCPICGNISWSGNDTPVEVRSFEEGRLGRSVIPFLTITCYTCGNTLFFNAILAGLVAEPEHQ
jgi:predicted nucleic-acid-binding Zn-ribbon protein